MTRIFIDLNARMTERGYIAACNGSIADLARAGHTLESATGKHFTFVAEDADKNGEPGAFVFNGVIVLDPQFGYLAEVDDNGINWVPGAQLSGNGA